MVPLANSVKHLRTNKFSPNFLENARGGKISYLVLGGYHNFGNKNLSRTAQKFKNY
jgi:hypothetical protein